MASAFHERLLLAWHHLEGRRGGKRVTGELFGQLVAQAEGGRGAFSKSAISQWRSGKHVPPHQTIRAIAKVCGVNLRWLEDDEGPMLTASSTSVERGAEDDTFTPVNTQEPGREQRPG